MRYARPHRRRIRLAMASSFLNKVFDLAPPGLIGAAVDIVVRREDSLFSELGIPDVKDQLWALAIVTFLIWLLESAFEYFQKVLWRNLGQTIQHELRLDTYAHLQAMDLSYFESQRTGGLMAVLNDDVNQLERFLDIGANDLIQVTTTAVSIGAIFFWISPEIAALSVLPVPFVIWGSFAFQSRIAPRYRAVRDQAAVVNSQLASNLTGVATIKSYVAEDREVARLRELSEEYRQRNKKAIALSSAFSPLIRMVIVLGFTATLVLGGIFTLDGELEVGTYSVMVFLTQRLLWPLTRLGETFDQYQRAMASTTRIMDVLDHPVVMQGGATTLDASQVKGRIEFDRVSFAYTGREPVLTDLSFTIEPDTTVAFVGSTGAGKSTIAKLLMRLYDPVEGEIRLDGVPLPELDLADLRRAIGLVNQDTYLFHGSVAENVEYGRPGATPEDLQAATRKAEAQGFVDALPERFDTVVGEWGMRLSGGQRQRLSIARAVLKDPPVLILDEATSAVDNETEAAIQRSMETIAQGRVTVMIAHRLSTVRNCDRIMVLADGGIAEAGTHEELIALDGAYAALWRVQTGEAAAH